MNTVKNNSRFFRFAGLMGLAMGLTIGLAYPLAYPSPAIAQVTEAKIIEILDGDQVFINTQKARTNAVGRFNQTVRTQAARMGVRFNTPGGARLDRNSSMIVGKCVRIERGRAMMSGQLGRNGCVGRVEVRSRGTVYVMELGDDQQGRVTVLEGEVEIFNPDAPTSSTIALKTGDSVTITADGQLSSVQPSSSSQLQSISASLFEGFQQSLPDLEKVAILKRVNEDLTGGLSDIEIAFLDDALFGRDHYSDGVKGQDNTESFLSIPGFFVKINNEVTFSPDSPFTAPLNPALVPNPVSLVVFSGDLVNGSLTSVTLGGPALTPSRAIAGLSGNNAIGEITLSDGRVIRGVVFEVNGQTIVDNQSYPGELRFAPARLTTIGPGRRDR